ncbi:unnamed protein product [Blepharisma stoltei]|uniref:non-specific serine/threonine protein kinase n=1 Tax=Blepharisma stoltei TaxID=1481888 RepID=A0AAU9J766_9CILI|nr:unnamed protein product [Blepharisma stoltei]
MGSLCNKTYIERPQINRRSAKRHTSILSIKSMYNSGKVLGTGTFGIVRVGWPKSNPHHKVAIKSIDKGLVKNFEVLRTEVEILVGLDHPNIIRLYESYEDDRYFHIVMELCEGGELWDSLLNKGHYKEKDAAELMIKILRAVNHLHKINICHRDLKPENFMFDSKDHDAELKLIDFGLSQKFGSNSKSMTSIVGTPYYVAPEVLKGSYGFMCDMWSVGVIMFMLLCGDHPFVGKDKEELYSHILQGSYEFKSVHWRGVSSQAKDLIRKMLALEPKNRITAEEALCHPWFGFTETNEIHVSPGIIASLKHFKLSSSFQKEVLAYFVNELNHDQIKDLKEAFNSLDTHKNGFITLSDFITVIANSEEHPKTREIEALFWNLDYNKDGRINYSEFLAATLESKHIINEEKLWSAFRHFDPNNTGKITAISLKSALRRAGKVNVDADELIREVDYDKDGGVNFEEFRKIVQG